MIKFFRNTYSDENDFSSRLINWVLLGYTLLVSIHLLLTLIIIDNINYLLADLSVLIVFVIVLFLKHKKVNHTIITIVFATLCQPIIFFYFIIFNGSKGPFELIVLTNIFLLISLDKKKRYIKIFIFCATCSVLFLVFEQFYPEYIKSFPSQEIEIFNLVFILLSVYFIINLSINIVKRYYLKEKENVQNQNKKLENTISKIEFKKEYLTTLKSLQADFLLERDLTNSYQQVLQKFLEGTLSEYGIIGEIDESNPLKYQILAQQIEQSKIQFDQTFQENVVGWLKKNGLSTLLEDCNKKKKIIASSINLKTTDKIYPKLYYLYIPVIRNNDFAGFVILLNFSRPYVKNDIDLVQLFTVVFYTINQSIRLNRNQQKNEDLLRQSKIDADENLRVKSQFFTNISHELRTPLSLIIGPISALINDNDAKMDFDKVKNTLSLSLDNSNKIRLFIEDISNLSKLSVNNLQIQKTTYNFYTFVYQIYSNFKVQTMYRDIGFNLDYNANKSLDLYFDIRKLENILSNLLSNAFKFTPDKGTINLVISDLGENLLIEVCDTGVGVSYQDLPNIFDRFFQTKDKHKNIFSGTGVGLALSQELAQLMGFKISVISKMNEGSTFFFKIKKSEFSNTVVTQNKQDDETLNNVEMSNSILIVEDNYSMNEFLKDLLKQSYSVTGAINGKEALKVLEESTKKIDLIITDLMMPQMDGFAFMDALKSKPDFKDIPLLVLTAMHDETVRVDALKLGASEFISKPFSTNELKIKIKNLLSASKLKNIVEEQQNVTVFQEDSKDHQTSKLTVQIKEIVHANLDNSEFSIEDVAINLNISKRNLYRYIQNAYGITPLKMIRNVRLDVAKEYLENNTYKSLKEVVFATGFNTVRHFKKCFYDRFKLDPSFYFKG